MKPAGIIGIILIIAGAFILIYGSITYTTHKKVIDVGPLQASTKQHKTIPLPPIVGIVLIGGGVVLVIAGRKKA